MHAEVKFRVADRAGLACQTGQVSVGRDQHAGVDNGSSTTRGRQVCRGTRLVSSLVTTGSQTSSTHSVSMVAKGMSRDQS